MSTIDTRARQAYVALRQRIHSGELAAGTRLVNRTLATSLGLSMTPVREAISRLASDGVVEFVPGAGAIVRRLNRNDLEQVFELRELVEPRAAAQAAQFASPIQIEELSSTCADGKKMAQQWPAQKQLAARAAIGRRWSDMETEFHLAVARASNNLWLLNVVDGILFLHAMSLVQHSIGSSLLDRRAALQLTSDHMRVCQAIGDHDIEKAEQMMREHIQLEKRIVLSRFDPLPEVRCLDTLTCP